MTLVPCKIAANSGLRAEMKCLAARTKDFDWLLERCDLEPLDSLGLKAFDDTIKEALDADEVLLAVIATAKAAYTERINKLTNLIP